MRTRTSPPSLWPTWRPPCATFARTRRATTRRRPSTALPPTCPTARSSPTWSIRTWTRSPPRLSPRRRMLPIELLTCLLIAVEKKKIPIAAMVEGDRPSVQELCRDVLHHVDELARHYAQRPAASNGAAAAAAESSVAQLEPPPKC